MKKKSLSTFSTVLLIGILSGCSSMPKQQDKRAVASKEYECHFEDTMNGEKTEFIFAPEAMRLTINSPKSGSDVVYLEVDNFVTGGYTYVQGTEKKQSSWDVSKIKFISYSATPNVVVDFKRTPASKELSIAKNCN